MMQINLNDLYQQQDSFLNTVSNPNVASTNRGIVTTCYDAEFAGCWVLLRELERLGSELPITIFYRSGELTNQQLMILISANTNVYVQMFDHDIKDYVDRYGNRKGWATKIHAVLDSKKYNQVLWIDSDNIPVQNPDILFQDPEFLKHGSLFWRDLMSPDSSNEYNWESVFWKIFRVIPNDSELFETGQLLVDKSRNWTQLQLVKHFCDNSEIYFNWGGDKECWRMAWQHISCKTGNPVNRLNYHSGSVPYGMNRYGPLHLGEPNAFGKWGGGSVMVQRDREGQHLFNHRTMAKLNLKNNIVQRDIINEEIYHRYIEELRNILQAGN